MASTFQIDREKYLELVRTQGLDAAITALHHDKEEWELATFEGQDGYQRDMWNALETVRAFSRELWDYSIQNKPA